jgi:hypothetical protein
MIRYTSRTATEVVMHFHLVFDEAGTLKLSRSEPRLNRGERSMALALKVPRTLWQTPQLSASIEITDPGNPKAEIDVKAASDALREVTGLDIDVQIVPRVE